MATFIYNIIDFVNSIINTIGSGFGSGFTTFLTKDVFNQYSYIGINITYGELFTYVATLFLVIFFIVFFVRLIFKVIGLICLR